MFVRVGDDSLPAHVTRPVGMAIVCEPETPTIPRGDLLPPEEVATSTEDGCNPEWAAGSVPLDLWEAVIEHGALTGPQGRPLALARMIASDSLRHERTRRDARTSTPVGPGGPLLPLPAPFKMGRMLDEARVLGLDRVLAVCAVDNVASVKTIERCGGVFEGIRETKFGPARRYWIEL
jgi:hypothetical protein